MTWRLHQTHQWPAPAKVAACHYDAWKEAVRAAAVLTGPIGFKTCELQVEVEDRSELNLPVLLCWIERLLGELRILPAGTVVRGATIWRNDTKQGVRVTLWEAGSAPG